MKFRIALISLFLVLAGPSALAWDAKDLQGKWVITELDGEDTGDRSDVWEFKGDQWIAWTSGRALPGDPFSVTGNVIDLGYAKIKVLEFSGKRMKTEQMGFVYTLERQ